LYDSTVLSAACKASVLNNQQFVYKGNNLSVMTHEDLIQTLYNIIKDEMDKLGGNYARILHMKLLDNMKIREISKELDINESTIKNYLYKGKEMLNTIMKNEHRSLYNMYLESCQSVDETNLFGI
jgi:DNA-directed RNA polymerase specialized sigma24 family protein